MIGNLVWTGCERSADSRLQFLELWSYPDGTLNIVAANEAHDDCEHTFPIAVEQLEGILRGRPLQLHCAHVCLKLEAIDDRVCSTCQTQFESWTQCVPLGEFCELIHEIKLATPFVA